MPPQEIEHPGLDAGTLDVVPVDADNHPSLKIWNRAEENHLDCTIMLTDWFAGAYNVAADEFVLDAYFDPAMGGAVVHAGGAIFTGDSGALDIDGANTTLTFAAPLAVSECRIDVPANSLDIGPYRVTVVLTHTPGGVNPRIAGFYDLGIIQLFEP